MKGFLGTAAAMVFAFSLITAVFTFMLAGTALSDSSRAGLAVEMARWAVEADIARCGHNTNVYESPEGIGVQVIEVNGNTSTITSYPFEFFDLTANISIDYPPRAHLTETEELVLTICPEDSGWAFVEYEYWDEENEEWVPETSSLIMRAVIERNGERVYSNNVTTS